MQYQNIWIIFRKDALADRLSNKIIIDNQRSNQKGRNCQKREAHTRTSTHNKTALSPSILLSISRFSFIFFREQQVPFKFSP